MNRLNRSICRSCDRGNGQLGIAARVGLVSNHARILTGGRRDENGRKKVFLADKRPDQFSSPLALLAPTRLLFIKRLIEYFLREEGSLVCSETMQ